ncbi:hypothetical protein PFISCL1PPCAC_24381 [Pristionchus fissidentatus]|uniref:Metalloendopeptidase n=1 Tax=Pristionchus fissidentatus TaxID=1538716 RepID=A0AAV5WTR8_9BILA|nr:hypothetical protein PFISCL1PPCAC_24381 [Pristionchus fissidentatus]
MFTHLLLLSLIGFSIASVHQFTHSGPHERHVVQSEFDHLRSIAHVTEGEAQLVPSPSHGPEITLRQKRSMADTTVWNMRNGKELLGEEVAIPRVARNLRAKRGFMEEEFHWSNGKGRIVERNPSPGFFDNLGNGLDQFTKGMANKWGMGGAGKDNNGPVQSGGGIGQILDKTTGGSGGLLSGLTGWVDKLKLPIPKMMLKDPMAFVPDSMKNVVSFLKQKWGELSAVARGMISEVCRTRINCQAQSAQAINLRNTIKDKLRQFRNMFGVGNEKELNDQFDRTQQVKKALLSRAGLEKEVEPADDGVFDSDTLLTTKQSEMLLNQLGQGGRNEVQQVPEAPTSAKSAKRAAIFFEDEFFQKWDIATPIPYIFDGSISNWEKTDIRDALTEISSKTCIRFAEQNYKPNGYHINYVKIASASFCGLSYIGRTAPANPVYLSFACGEGKGVALHETLHALGAAHEHVRMDRDQHIKVDWSNIDPRYYDAFAVSDPKTFTTYGVKYDYGSIMHYRFNSAAINAQKATMTALVNERANTALLGQRKGLSQNDVLLLNRLYCKPDSCIDTNVYCGAWALQGVCTKAGNNVWMSQNCRKSCGLC